MRGKAVKRGETINHSRKKGGNVKHGLEMDRRHLRFARVKFFFRQGFSAALRTVMNSAGLAAARRNHRGYSETLHPSSYGSSGARRRFQEGASRDLLCS